MKKSVKITGSAVSIAGILLFSLSGDAIAAGGQVRGFKSKGNANLCLDPVEPAYTRLNEDPADGEVGFKKPVHMVVPAKKKVQVVGPKFGPKKLRPK